MTHTSNRLIERRKIEERNYATSGTKGDDHSQLTTDLYLKYFFTQKKTFLLQHYVKTFMSLISC